MIPIIISSLGLVLIVYLGIGFAVGGRATGIDDLLPMGRGKQARVNNSAEFSASTVATTISFAMVIMAFFDLAAWFGIWLLWTVVTTAGGLLFVRFFAGKIWDKMNSYERKPTLHEFLGSQYDSGALAHVGAVCTSLGFLGAFAAELTVGSIFFRDLLPGIAPWVIVLVLSTVAFLYTAIGGFRAVIVTDRVQMFSIWLLLLSLPTFYCYYIFTHGGWSVCFANIPEGTLTFSTQGRVGLLSFMLGIFVINVPTYLSDMSVWQRIAGAQERETVTRGLFRGVFSASVTWGALVMLACMVFMIVTPPDGENPLITLLKTVSQTS
ncbi:MAG: hypothetical protein KAS23_01420, partial [Anaerohalosphaera sp.]|nr:hypothetical protein [Anaerohalosphaera sp.]